jgi:hypothetical protein
MLNVLLISRIVSRRILRNAPQCEFKLSVEVIGHSTTSSSRLTQTWFTVPIWNEPLFPEESGDGWE